MEQTTSLRTKMYDSSLIWNIEHFLDYESCCIDKIRSREISFHDTKASWFLEVWPRFIDEGSEYVKVSFVLNDNVPSKHRLFKAEIEVDGDGHHMMSPANRHMVKSQGFYADPEYIKPPCWVLDYQPNLQKSFENDHFMTHGAVAGFLNGGVLTLKAKVRLLNYIFLPFLIFFGLILGLHQNSRSL